MHAILPFVCKLIVIYIGVVVRWVVLCSLSSVQHPLIGVSIAASRVLNKCFLLYDMPMVLSPSSVFSSHANIR